ncbi:hypothetical protein CES86_1260 [Brucella lupini]|uniref:Uncharacterized protein n=1 Tax=Brucella lupini TaxID=255457 RepID=A0A256GWN1_9HYPH|nr:hypothetical protein CES86_1260 [Brucella lupini]
MMQCHDVGRDDVGHRSSGARAPYRRRFDQIRIFPVIQL